MKIGLISSVGTIESLAKHSENCVLERKLDISHWLVEDPTINAESELPVGNTCIGMQRFYIDKEMQVKILSMLEITPKPAVSSIFALFNGKEFSPWMEISFSGRFMNNEVGPEVGFSTGVGLIPQNISDAVPQIERLKGFLTSINYRGEILCKLAQDFTICEFLVGHFYGHFGIFAEASKDSTESLLGYIFGEVKKCELWDTVVVGNIVSHSPFPLNLDIPSKALLAPQSAEKHLWRIRNGYLNYVLVCTHGKYLQEARNRLRRTLDNMVSYCDSLQFRTDYGFHRKFLLCEDKYKEISEKKFSPLFQVSQTLVDKETEKDK